MNRLLILPLLCACSLLGTSCYAPYGTVQTKRGTVLGGLVGAGTGAIVGNQSGRGLEGAAIGGAVGALAGGLLGSARDEAYYGSPAAPPPPPQPYYGTVYRPAPVVPIPIPVPVYRSYGYNRYYSGGYYHRGGYGRFHAPRYSNCR